MTTKRVRAANEGRRVRLRRSVGPCLLLVALGALLWAQGCGSSDGGGSAATAAAGTTATGEETTADAVDEPTATPVNVKKLPVGTDQYSTDGAEKGKVYSCITDFNGSGAFTMGPWFSDDGKTYDSTDKVHVEGSVKWDSEFSAKVKKSARKLSGNGLPANKTGTFPVEADDPAYEYDRNPNSISGYDLIASLPADPEVGDDPSCVGGTIGVTTTGVPIYSAFDAGGRDAVAWETQDDCDGHPEVTGQYHFHSLSPCVESGSKEPGTELVGWALDGFGIYVERDAEGTMLSSADLDKCHGRTGTVEWDGQQVEMYHYVATVDFPYLVACYRGTPITEAEGLAIGAPDQAGQAGGG